MGFRNTLILTGIILIVGSYFWGIWTVWFGAPLIFIGIVLKFLEKD